MKRILAHYKDPNGNFWFRIFGYGLSFYKEAMFSDRHFKNRKYFNYYIKLLKPLNR